MQFFIKFGGRFGGIHFIFIGRYNIPQLTFLVYNDWIFDKEVIKDVKSKVHHGIQETSR